MSVRIIQGDCREVLRGFAPDSIDACVTDPPYGIGFMGKKWDTPGAFVERKPAKENRWDKIGGNHSPENAADAARTRRVEAVKYQQWCEEWASELFRVMKPGAHLLAFGGTRTHHRMVCALEDAGFEIRDEIQWIYGQGFPKSKKLGDGWGTALKPAAEPICVARKPPPRTVTDSFAELGTGGLNIESCRIGAGRWPANVMLDEEAAAALDAQSGTLRSGEVKAHHMRNSSQQRNGGGYRGNFGDMPLMGYGDSGGASRFFYCAKASKNERGEGNTHATVKPLALMRYLLRLVTPPGGTVLDLFVGSGTTLLAAQQEGIEAIGIELLEEHVAIAERRLAQGALLLPTG